MRKIYDGRTDKGKEDIEAMKACFLKNGRTMDWALFALGFIQDECAEIVPKDMAEENMAEIYPRFSRTEARAGFQ